MIAVTFALPAESSDFVRLLAKRRSVSQPGVEWICGEFHGRPVAIVHTGVGEKACRPRIESFLQRQPVECLISAGFAGALDPKLHIGDLIIAENHSSASLLQSPKLRLTGMAVHLGRMVTVPMIVGSTEERAELARRTAAAAVDMETEFIAAACALRGVPLISLRAISDTSGQPFPAPPHVLFDVDRQKTNFARLAFYVLSHPTSIKRLLTFAERIAMARAALTTAISTLLRTDLAGALPSARV